MREATGVEAGLDGIVVAETGISQIDGERGRLIVRGHDVEDLAGRVGYEDVFALLLDGSLPDPSARERVRKDLAEARAHAFARLTAGDPALETDDASDALRAGLARLEAGGDPRGERYRLAGTTAVLLGAWARKREGSPPLEPDASLGHAADLLRMATGDDPDPLRGAALDAYLLTVAEHGMNASTFTARVVASTRSDAVSVVVSALGALKGPLHGGAPGPVLDMLDAIREPARARAWLEAELDSGRRIMGLGHRIYRVRDPRAAILERALDALEAAGIESRYLDLARAVERAAVELLAERRPERRLETNVEFYTAVLLDAIGLDRALFTAAFAVARIAGWLAHADEQIRGGRILRPRQRYVGPLPEGGTTTRLSASG
ncbi:citrate synthase [Myxococcaceae bacterium]|nr:citrate synthase [Myxococcaceae bacterium]